MFSTPVGNPVISHETEEGCKIWRVINLSFQNWQKEFDKFLPEHQKSQKFSFNGLLLSKVYTFWAKKSRGVIFHETEKGYKIWREIDLSLQNWHKEFDKCWPEHSKISKIFTIFKVRWGRGHPPGPSHYEKPWITLLYFFSPNNINFAQREPIKMKVFESFKCSGQNSSSSLCQLWNDKSVPLYILRNSSLLWQIIPFWILSSYFFRFGLENPIKIPIFECSGKNLPYSYHVISQTTSQLKVMLDKSANNVLGAGM